MILGVSHENNESCIKSYELFHALGYTDERPSLSIGIRRRGKGFRVDTDQFKIIGWISCETYDTPDLEDMIDHNITMRYTDAS